MNNEQYVIAEIKSRLNLGEDDKIVFQKTVKNNGGVFDTCLINKSGEKISPNIYYNSSNEDDDIVEEICAIYNSNSREIDGVKSASEELINVFKDKDTFLSKVLPMLVNREKNTELLMKIPHTPYLNLEVIYYIDLPIGIAKVYNSHIDSLGVSLEEIHSSALMNLLNRSNKVESLFETMKRMYEAPLPPVEDAGLYIMTNKDGCYGATQMLNPFSLQKMQEKLGEHFYIIPSSIHEVICVPMKRGCEKILIDMVKEVNATNLSERNFLADSLYEYNKGKITEVA